MYKFWYNYIKSKYQNNAKLCYMDTDSVINNIKTEDSYEDIANDTSNYEVNRPLPTGENKTVIGVMKDKPGGKIMTEFVSIKPKTCSYLMDDDSEAKKTKQTKNCVIKRMLKFLDYKYYLMNNKVVLKSQQRFKSERHNVYTEKVNKIALSSNDDKRLQTYDRSTTYIYGYKHWESMQNKHAK